MSTVRFTKDHEWISVDGDVGTVGITDYAQEQLGDVVYVDLPEVGASFARGGEVVAVNDALDSAPATVNEDAQGRGWFLKLRLADPAELEELMTEDQYKAFLETVA